MLDVNDGMTGEPGRQFFVRLSPLVAWRHCVLYPSVCLCFHPSIHQMWYCFHDITWIFSKMLLVYLGKTWT